MRRRLAVLAAVPLLALTLGAGTATAAPAHQAAPARAEAFWPAYQGWWAPLYGGPVLGTRWAWSGSNQIYNAQDGGGGVAFDFNNSPCAPPPNQGYCALAEYAYSFLTGNWSATGFCAGWSQTLFRIVRQVCGNYSYQAWAGVVKPDGSHLIWSWWYDSYHHNECPVPGGYTQSVITSDKALGAVYLSCPQGAGGQSYLDSQSWFIEGTLIGA